MDVTKRNNRIKRLAVCSMLLAVSLIFSYVEALIPFNIGIPGIKLGLANIVVVFAMYTIGDSYGIYINFTRVVITAFLFGTGLSALYSAAGCLVSFFAMLALKRTKLFSAAGVSMAGGVFHNLGQLFAAILVLSNIKIIYYFPVLLLSGMLTGIINGFLASLIIRRIKIPDFF